MCIRIYICTCIYIYTYAHTMRAYIACKIIRFPARRIFVFQILFGVSVFDNGVFCCSGCCDIIEKLNLKFEMLSNAMAEFTLSVWTLRFKQSNPCYTCLSDAQLRRLILAHCNCNALACTGGLQVVFTPLTYSHVFVGFCCCIL